MPGKLTGNRDRSEVPIRALPATPSDPEPEAAAPHRKPNLPRPTLRPSTARQPHSAQIGRVTLSHAFEVWDPGFTRRQGGSRRAPTGAQRPGMNPVGQPRMRRAGPASAPTVRYTTITAARARPRRSSTTPFKSSAPQSAMRTSLGASAPSPANLGSGAPRRASRAARDHTSASPRTRGQHPSHRLVPPPRRRPRASRWAGVGVRRGLTRGCRHHIDGVTVT